MMKMSFFGIVLCLTAVTAYAGNRPPSNTSLTDLNQNLAFRPRPQAGLFLDRPVFSYSFKLAKVHFVVDKSDKIGFEDIDQNFDHNDAERCKKLGFNISEDCPANYFKSRLCPYNSIYYERCCNNDFKYSKAECSYPNTISSTSCGGKYKCYCDTDLYPYTSANCPAPKELSDKCVDDGGSHYALCSCPSYYKPCSGSNQQGVGTSCSRNGETVYSACECKAGYNQVCEQFGPTNPSDYCLNGGKFYKSCKTCPNKGTLDRCPTGFACTLEQCSGKSYITGCETGYTNITGCDWMKCWMPWQLAPEA